MANKGNALMGIGIGSGEERITEAARKAIFSPLLETTIDGAEDVIVNVTGGLDMTLTEAEEASEIISQAAGKGVNIWLGTSIDDTMKDEIRVTVVATGVRQDRAEPVQAEAADHLFARRAEAIRDATALPAGTASLHALLYRRCARQRATEAGDGGGQDRDPRRRLDADRSRPLQPAGNGQNQRRRHGECDRSRDGCWRCQGGVPVE